MFTLSTFSELTSLGPQVQIAILQKCRLRHTEFGSTLRTNALALTDL